MQTKELLEALGIDRERIKYYKKNNVFFPEKPSKRGWTDFTDQDRENLTRLVVLTKAGLTCGDILSVQNGELTLCKALEMRRKRNQEELERIQASLAFSEELLSDEAQYADFETDRYWEEIRHREKDGEQFMDVDDTYGPISMVRSLTCPFCGKASEIDLAEFVCDESSDGFPMGPDVVYTFDPDAPCECPACGKEFRIEGWIREYPVGGYDSEKIDIITVED